MKQNETSGKFAQQGQALTELIFFVPLAFILIFGLHTVHSSLKVKLDQVNNALNQNLSARQIPDWLKPHWPTAGSPLQSVKLERNLEMDSFVPLRTCHYTLAQAALTKTPLGDTEFEPLTHQLERVRTLSLRVVRMACLTEGTTKAGPVNAALVLTGISHLHSESIRKEGFYAFCPIVSQSSQNLRTATVTMVNGRAIFDTVTNMKMMKSLEVICVP